MAPASSALVRYAIASASVVLATATWIAFPHSSGSLGVFLVLFVPVQVSAVVGGLGPGLLACALGALALSFGFLEPVGSLEIALSEHRVMFALWLAIGGATSVFSERAWRLHRALRDSAHRLAEREAVLRIAIEAVGATTVVIDHTDGMVEYPQRDRRAPMASWLASVLPDDRAALIEAGRKALGPAGDGRIETEFRVQTAHGGVRWYRLLAETEFAPAASGRKPARTIGLVGDITEQRERESRRVELERAALEHESSARQQAIVAAAVDAIAIIDERGELDSVNPALEGLFGYACDEVIGKNVTCLMPEPHRSEHEGYLRAYLTTGERKIIGIGREVLGQRKDGSTFPMYLSVAEVRIDGRRLFAGNMHDLSARKHLEAQLLQAQKMEAIGALAGGVAHDFNNLITAILGSATLAEGHAAANPALTRALERIRLAATRGEALTKQLLAFSRRQVTKPELLGLNAAVREARELFERMIGEDVRVQLELADDAGAVRIDPNQLDQVILNLVVNARDAMPKGGTLRLATRAHFVDEELAARLAIPDGLYSTLTIADNGGGIPPEILARVFEPFFTTKPPGRGTGLGLSTVLAIVRAHGGAIACESKPGEGTEFEIFLPRLAEEAQPASVVRAQTRAPHAPPRVILVVEDDELMRDLMCEVLELEGHRVLAADRAERAIELARSTPIDLLITDVVMPEMTGFELVKELRGIGLDPRVIFMSGYTDQVLADRGELGSDDVFLRKPFEIDDLNARVAEVLA